MYYNTKGVVLPRGLGFGGTTSKCRLFLDDELDNCTSALKCASYEPGAVAMKGSFHIETLEVWGCGGDACMAAQKGYRADTAELINRARKVDKAQFVGTNCTQRITIRCSSGCGLSIRRRGQHHAGIWFLVWSPIRHYERIWCASFSPFGAPAAQPAASPFGGGMFGGAAAAKPSGFGGFGAASPAATPSAFGTTTSGFGAPATNAFGGQSTLGGGGFGGTAFGAPAAAPASGFGSNPFGQPTPATTGAFGAPAAQTGFGGFGAAPATGQALVGTGPPASYKPTSEQETEKGKMTTVHFQSISKMPEYQHKSAEELRWEDYLKRTDPAAAQAQAALVPNTGGAAPAATNMFGQPSTTAASAFGKPPLGGGFGQAAAPATGGFGGGFGAPAAPSAFGGGGGFGSSNTSFGAPAAAPTTTSFSFGNNAAAGT
ncbi:hypothetical protein DYB26_010422, partial [Aphanomyces astaci]